MRTGKYFSLKDWLIRDWDKPFDIIDEYSVNLGEMLKAKGVKIKNPEA